MFFKKLLVGLLLIMTPLSSFAIFEEDLKKLFEGLTCTKKVTAMYPYFLTGELEVVEDQDYFFTCLYGFLDAIVNKKIIYHTDERDHFTRAEIFKLFHVYFEKEREEARRITQKVLFVKKLLIGGSIDNIKDKELELIMKLILPYYREVYWIIHKEIPILKKLFRRERVDPGRRQRTAEQMRKASLHIANGYKKFNISYTVKDFSKYPEYIDGFLTEDLGQNTPGFRAIFTILQNLFQGSIFPHQEIKGDNWYAFAKLIHRSIDVLYYHNEFFPNKITGTKLAYNSLGILKSFLPLLSANKKLFEEKGFPLQNIDNIIGAGLEFLLENQDQKGVLEHLRDKKRIRFLTRTLFAFSLNPNKSETEKADWDSDPSRVSFSFKDYDFYLYEDHFTERKKRDTFFITEEQIDMILNWSNRYQDGVYSVFKGKSDPSHTENLAIERGMDHWMEDFFGWDESNEMTFGSFDSSDSNSKILHLLGYQSFLSLLLNQYLPVDDPYAEISKEQWNQIVSEIAPLFFVAFGAEGMSKSFRDPLEDAFTLSDLFINSSNVDGVIQSRELSDLVIHVISAVKQSQKQFPRILKLCRRVKDSVFAKCATDVILKDDQVLEAYPRFKDFLITRFYKKPISRILSNLDREESSLQLLELFLLIQIMQVNFYQRINANISFNLESEELIVFANSLKHEVAKSIPYLTNEDQALAYILYSFKSGALPFFTGDEIETLRFSNWYLNPEARSDFSINAREFHLLAFEFYNLYKRF